MVKNSIAKDLFREIKKSAGRFVSITLLLFLATGFFSGLRATRPDMLITADKYFDEHNMFDIRVMSNLGLTEEDVAAMSQLGGVESAEGMNSVTAIASRDGRDFILAIKPLSKSGMSTPELISGRMPEAPGECLAEWGFMRGMGLSLGGSFDIGETEKSGEDRLAVTTFTIVGTARSPEFITYAERGVTSLGNGRVSAFLYVTREAFNNDFYTEVSLAVSGADRPEAYSDGYTGLVDSAKDELSALGETRGDLRRQELVKEATDELDDARLEVSEKKAELSDGKKELRDAQTEYENGVTELEEKRLEAEREFKDAEEKLASSQREVTDAKNTIEEGARTLAREKETGEQKIYASYAELDQSKAALAVYWEEYYAGKAELDAGIALWSSLNLLEKALYQDRKTELDALSAQLEQAYSTLTAQQSELDGGYAAAAAGRDEFEAVIAQKEQELQTGQAELLRAQAEIDSGAEALEAARADADREFVDAEKKLADAGLEIADAETELADGEKKLREAELEIEDAQKEIDDIPQAEWFVLDRSISPGYTGYSQDADRVGALAQTIPIIFFAVSALVCLTGMTRMVEDRRVEIGTFKAMGFSKAAAAVKFILYGAFAAVTGTILGLGFGMGILPRFIFKAYSMLYDMPPLVAPVHWEIIIVSAAVSLLCTVGATLAACLTTLRETPASLMRPRAPKPGQRVFLEYITPFWRRLSFLGKVTARNLLRYKKRLIMTIVGIAGCTALIVAGIGTRGSILDIPIKQFEDVYKYHLQVSLVSGESKESLSGLYDTLEGDLGVSDYIITRFVSADFSANSAMYSGEVIIPEVTVNFDDFIHLKSSNSRKTLVPSENGVIISQKLSEMLKLKIGDEMTISTGNRYVVTIAGISEQYVFHNAYMSREYYEQVFAKPFEGNTVLINCADNSVETSDAVSRRLLTESAVSYLAYFKSIANLFQDAVSSINYVVAIVIGAAAMLAFIVLFNLTSINIMERKRELATVKVLGFYDMEVTWYIVRENIILTVVSTAVGLFAGKYLHNWLVRSVEIDMTMFGRKASALSYILAASLTLIFAAAVNFFGHAKMKRISMVESLKINE